MLEKKETMAIKKKKGVKYIEIILVDRVSQLMMMMMMMIMQFPATSNARQINTVKESNPQRPSELTKSNATNHQTPSSQFSIN